MMVLARSAQFVGRHVWHYAELPSTNATALELVRTQPERAAEGLAIWADAQSAGHGQHGRTWHSPPGAGVWLSVIVQPPDEWRRPAPLTAWAAVATAEAIYQLTGLHAKIKWPNDLLLNGRKVSGILIEQAGTAVVAGVGLNVTPSHAELADAGLPQATSLQASSGHALRTERVAEVLLQHLDEQYTDLMNGELNTLTASWKWRLGLLGRTVRAETVTGEVFTGRLREVTFATVVLETAEGTRELLPESLRGLGEVGR
jgi:BirA family biotin operon repressor/biotin-[acetyl-CoA-carboxylase] ligase